MPDGKMLKLREMGKPGMLDHATTNKCCLFSLLEVDLPDDGLGHVLVLPRATVHLFELDAVQAEQWDLDDEDLEAQSHAGAEVALDVGASFACCALLS
jgi:hypothetical protein